MASASYCESLVEVRATVGCRPGTSTSHQGMLRSEVKGREMMSCTVQHEYATVKNGKQGSMNSALLTLDSIFSCLSIECTLIRITSFGENSNFVLALREVCKPRTVANGGKT